MKNTKMMIFFGLISLMAFLMTACSDETDKSTSNKENTGDHVWKTQTDALKSAKEMAKELQKSLDQQQEKLEESN